MADYAYDLAVVGGGIHGAGVAQAAAANGYSVLVLEQSALAAGTSSRSSKLIHGGLRYLESAQFSVVRECLHERALLLKLAPDLVRLQPFYSPIYHETCRRPWQMTLGLSLYRVLGGFHPSGEFRRIPKREWPILDGLRRSELDAVFCFWDAQTDDRLLTQAVMRSAQSLGCELALPATLLAAELDQSGCSINYQYNGRQQSCRVRALVNAAGPWANRVIKRVTPEIEPCSVDLVQGSHIILPGRLERGIYYVEAPQDKRAVFLMPWQGNTLIGTTEHLYRGDPGQVYPLPEEVTYLCRVARYYFPQFNECKPLDAFAGLRVLPSGKGSAFGRSRETILHPDRQSKPRLLTIYGGKLTAYRATAETVIERLRTTLPHRKPIADTRRLPLLAND